MTRKLGSVRLWRDDLAGIVGVIQEVHPVGTLEADSYTFDRVDELAQLDELRIERFSLVTSDGKVRLVLGRDVAEITAEEPDIATRGLLGEVAQICKENRRLPWAEVTYALAVCSVTAGFLKMVMVVLNTPEGERSELPEWLALGFLASLSLLLVLTGLAISGKLRPRALLSTRTRDEAPPWLTRNRDGLVTNAIVSAVFFAFGYALGQLQ